MYATLDRSADHAKPTAAKIRPSGNQDARTYLDSAYARLLDGDYDGAETDYRSAICLNPCDKDVKEDLARIGGVLCTMR